MHSFEVHSNKSACRKRGRLGLEQVAYNLQGKYTCHAFDPPVIIPEGEQVYPAKFMTPMRKTSYWYHEPDESIPFILSL